MIMVDLNVILDVVQRRDPHYTASARVLSRVVSGEVAGALPGHAMTTLHYIVARHSGKGRANDLVDWLLRYFTVAPVGRLQFERARQLPISDFEDAVVAACAEMSGCECVVTRNLADFAGSSLPAVTPSTFLQGSAER